LPGQKTTTTPYGRDTSYHGFPIKVCELLSTLDAPAYIERTTIENVPEIIKTKRAIKKAFKYQIENKGFSLVEVLSSCPTNWKMSPSRALEWVGNVMKKYFPTGVYRDKFKEGN